MLCEFVQFLYVWFALAGQWMPLFYVVSSDILCLGLFFFSSVALFLLADRDAALN